MFAGRVECVQQVKCEPYSDFLSPTRTLCMTLEPCGHCGLPRDLYEEDRKDDNVNKTVQSIPEYQNREPKNCCNLCQANGITSSFEIHDSKIKDPKRVDGAEAPSE